MSQDKRQSRVLVNILPNRLVAQIIQLFQKCIDMGLDLRGGLEEELLMDGRLGICISCHVRIVELFLHIWVSGEYLGVENDVPYLLGYLTGVLIEEHSGKVVADIDELGSGLDVHHFAKGCGGGFVEEPISRKEGRGVRGTPVRHAKRRSSWYICSGVSLAISLLVESDLYLGLGSVVEHVGHGDDELILARLTPAAGVHGIEGPLEDLVFLLEIVGDDVYLGQDLHEVIEFESLGSGEVEDEGREALVAKVGHGHGIVIEARERVEPGEVVRLVALLELDEELEDEVELGDRQTGSDAAHGLHGILDAAVAHGQELLLAAGGGEDHVGGDGQYCLAGGEIVGGDDGEVEAVLGGELEALDPLHAALGRPFLERLEVSLG